MCPLKGSKINQRLATQGYHIEGSESLISYLASAGFDARYGARPLKRLLQQSVENPLAQQILAGKLLPDRPILLTQVAGKLEIQQA